MNIDENKIIVKCQNGDSEAFGLLYDAYIKKIYNFVYYKTHNKETAEDLVSQAFMKALKNINSFKAEKGKFSSWLYAIARNLVIDFYRSTEISENIDDVWDLSDDCDIEKDIDVRNSVANVKQYLQKLSSSQREIVVMRVWEGLSYKEIADILGKSEDSCKMNFSRVIRKLRKEMPLAAFLLFLTM